MVGRSLVEGGPIHSMMKREMKRACCSMPCLVCSVLFSEDTFGLGSYQKVPRTTAPFEAASLALRVQVQYRKSAGIYTQQRCHVSACQNPKCPSHIWILRALWSPTRHCSVTAQRVVPKFTPKILVPKFLEAREAQC